jgi:hypothetical protein
VLGEMDRRARQQAGFPALCDRGWVGARTIGADPVGGERRHLLQHLSEEAFSRVQVALRREEEVDRGAAYATRLCVLPLYEPGHAALLFRCALPGLVGDRIPVMERLAPGGTVAGWISTAQVGVA